MYVVQATKDICSLVITCSSGPTHEQAKGEARKVFRVACRLLFSWFVFWNMNGCLEKMPLSIFYYQGYWMPGLIPEGRLGWAAFFLYQSGRQITQLGGTEGDIKLVGVALFNFVIGAIGVYRYDLQGPFELFFSTEWLEDKVSTALAYLISPR